MSEKTLFNETDDQKTSEETNSDKSLENESSIPVSEDDADHEDDSKNKEGRKPRTRKIRVYPLMPFEECYNFAKAIYDYGSGQKVRRLDIFNHLKKSSESGAGRNLVTNTGKYGLIKGGSSSDYLEITPDGLQTVAEAVSQYNKHKAFAKLTIEDVSIFKFIHERFQGGKLPNQAVIIDLLKADYKDVEPEDLNTVVELFNVNAQYIQILKLLSGVERLLTIDHYLEFYSKSSTKSLENTDIDVVSGDSLSPTETTLENTCFYVTPIGDEGSPERMHSDLFLGSIVEPALVPLKLKVVRGDQIDAPGIISKQVIQYLAKAKLVIVDLSFNNPNVFYELAIRHAFRLPTVMIIRKSDRIPFDINHSRTIPIDTSSIFTLVPQLDSYRAQIASQARQALADPDSVDNLLALVYPSIKLTI